MKNKGYSVQIDKFNNGEYSEMFKYMIKDSATYIDPESGEKKFEILSFDEFKVLYFATPNVRQIAGFGVLKKIVDVENDDFSEVHAIYDNIIRVFDKLEHSKFIKESIDEVFNNDSLYISKKKIHGYIKSHVFDNEMYDYKEKDKKNPVTSNNRISIKEYKFCESLINEALGDRPNKKELLELVKVIITEL